MGDRFIEGAEDLSVPTIDSTDNATINDVIGNKEDTAQTPSSTTSIISILKKIYNLVLSISGEAGHSKVEYVNVTSPANSGDTTLITADTDIIVENVIVEAVTPQTSDMTSCGVFGGANNILTLIDHKDGKLANFNAINKQVSWSGCIHLSHDGTLAMEHVGTGNGALDLKVSIMFRGKIQ